MSRLLLRLMRSIAGRERAKWAEAMVAETGAARAQAVPWAWGCVIAAFIVRIRGSATTILAVLLLPVAAIALQSALFFPSAWIFQAFDLPRWTILSFTIFTPLPLAMLLGWLSAQRGALAPAIEAFCVFYASTMIQWCVTFGMGPSVFFDHHV